MRQHDSLRRALAGYLARYGTDLDGATVHTYETDRDRYAAWCIESLHEGIRQVDEMGDDVIALRCLIQAATFLGRIGGYHECALVGDAMTILQTEIARKLRGES